VTEHSDELIGPDLTQGLEVSSIHASQLIAGHAFGEPVLLVHVEPNWFAVGGKCTHYGAPLDQGILVSETIRCPWHHACFELRDGAASRAPALNDLPSYDVAVENNVVRVTRKRDRGQLKAEGHRARGSPAPERVLFEEKPTTGPESVVIIGGGAAGNACAEMLRREGHIEARSPSLTLIPMCPTTGPISRRTISPETRRKSGFHFIPESFTSRSTSRFSRG